MPEPWGGHSNGRIPREQLRRVQLAENQQGQRVDWHRLRTDASLALDRLLALCPPGKRYLTDSYRDLPTQVKLKKQKGVFAATPGTSNHGWAMAADCAFAHPRGFARWLWDHRPLALEHGWYPPAWTHDGRGIEEPWHWEYDHTRDRHHLEEPAGEGEDEMRLRREDEGFLVGMLQFDCDRVNRHHGNTEAILPPNRPAKYGPQTAAALRAALLTQQYAASGDEYGPAEQLVLSRALAQVDRREVEQRVDAAVRNAVAALGDGGAGGAGGLTEGKVAQIAAAAALEAVRNHQHSTTPGVPAGGGG